MINGITSDVTGSVNYQSFGLTCTDETIGWRGVPSFAPVGGPTGATGATGPAGGVSSLNSLTGALSIAAGSNITVTPSGSNITIAASGGGTPGGTNGQIQYNNSGSFGGISTTGSNNVVLSTSPTIATQTVQGFTEQSCLTPTVTSGTPNTIALTLTGVQTGCSYISTVFKVTYVSSASMTVTLPTPSAGNPYTVIVCGGSYTPTGITWTMVTGTLSWSQGLQPPSSNTTGVCDAYYFLPVSSSYLFGFDAGRNFVGN
jgi:hypothetical protein